MKGVPAYHGSIWKIAVIFESRLGLYIETEKLGAEGV